MSDKEIVFQAINKYAKDLASNLFHFNSVASQAVITYVVNILNKPVRFGEDDVNQLVEIFKTFKQNN